MPRGIAISSIPDCVADLKAGIADLNRLADEAGGQAPDDLFTPEDFDYLQLANPDALGSFESFEALSLYVDRYISERAASPQCQEEFGTSPESTSLHFGSIPECIAELKEELEAMDRMVNGGKTDGRISKAEFKRLKRRMPRLRGFRRFGDFVSFVEKTIESRRCDPDCLAAGKEDWDEQKVCVAPEAPELPKPPKRKRPKPEDGKPAMAENVEGPPPPEEAPAIAEGPPAPQPKSEPEPDLSEINTKITWNIFEKSYGADRLKREREEYQNELYEKRRSHGAFGKSSAKVLAALKNNRSWVRGAHTVPIGDSMDEFRNFIEIVHHEIHEIFAHEFLESLNRLPMSDPLNDFDMKAMLEFEILANGQEANVHVIKTSGHAVFDAAAVDAVYRAFPVVPPPEAILSWNRRVYMRWGFYRNNRMCGTFNAEPYIIKQPDGPKEVIPEDDLMMPAPRETAEYNKHDDHHH